MRVLLDENVPRKLKHRLAPEHDAVTVAEHGWTGLVNGALLLAADAEFDAFVTLDRGIVYQQNLSGLALWIVAIRAFSNTYEELLPLVPSIHAALARFGPSEIARVSG